MEKCLTQKNIVTALIYFCSYPYGTPCSDDFEKSNKDVNSKTIQIENDIVDIQETCEKIKINIEQLTEKLKNLKSRESRYENKMKENKANFDLLYKMTNLTWDSRKMERNILKGVVYKSGSYCSDVSTFEKPMKDFNNPVEMSDFLWNNIRK